MKSPDISVQEVEQILHKHDLLEIQLIGKGGQKTVFKCKFKDSSVFALKFLEIEKQHYEFSDIENEEFITEDIKTEVLARAKREVEIMKKCDSPNLVKLGPIGLEFTTFNNKNLLYFSEEFIDGENLQSIIKKRGKLNIEDALELAIDITMAIKELWKINMVHRDIKPMNIMKRNTGGFVLLDTGIAFDTLGTELTRTFYQVGTPLYRSPEQIKDQKSQLDFRSDLFLLGLVVYYSVTGRHPFITKNVKTEEQLRKNILHLTPEPPKMIVSEIPYEFNEIIMRLLAKEPHLRFKSCDILLNKLHGVREVL